MLPSVATRETAGFGGRKQKGTRKAILGYLYRLLGTLSRANSSASSTTTRKEQTATTSAKSNEQRWWTATVNAVLRQSSNCCSITVWCRHRHYPTGTTPALLCGPQRSCRRLGPSGAGLQNKTLATCSTPSPTHPPTPQHLRAPAHCKRWGVGWGGWGGRLAGRGGCSSYCEGWGPS
jgi:hypothetical protein